VISAKRNEYNRHGTIKAYIFYMNNVKYTRDKTQKKRTHHACSKASNATIQ